MTAAWAGTVMFCAFFQAIIANKGGRHLWDITAKEASRVSYLFNSGVIEYAMSICMTKLSIVWLYRRTFSTRKGSRFEILCFIFMAVLIAFYGGTGLAKVFECTPRAKIFNPTIPGTCVNFYAILIADGIFNTVTDFAILILPGVMIYKLQMKPKKKLIVLLIFTFGLSAPLFSIAGLIVRVQKGQAADQTWELIAILPWAIAELTTGTMCVCIPEMGLLFKKKERQSSSKPTQSILNGARSAIRGTRERNKKHGYYNGTLPDSDQDLVGQSSYIELEDGHPGVGYKNTAFSGPVRSIEGLEIPEKSVHVRTEVKVESV